MDPPQDPSSSSSGTVKLKKKESDRSLVRRSISQFFKKGDKLDQAFAHLDRTNSRSLDVDNRNGTFTQPNTPKKRRFWGSTSTNPRNSIDSMKESVPSQSRNSSSKESPHRQKPPPLPSLPSSTILSSDYGIRYQRPSVNIRRDRIRSPSSSSYANSMLSKKGDGSTHKMSIDTHTSPSISHASTNGSSTPTIISPPFLASENLNSNSSINSISKKSSLTVLPSSGTSTPRTRHSSDRNTPIAALTPSKSNRRHSIFAFTSLPSLPFKSSRPVSIVDKADTESKQASHTIPEPTEKQTPAEYLDLLKSLNIPRSVISEIITTNSDQFHLDMLKAFMRGFDYSKNPLDMALRRLLIHLALPKESQEVYRALEAFSNRWYVCNPTLFPSEDAVMSTSYALLLLHTDFFNKNNKRKMSKPEFVRNCSGSVDCPQEVLECFYDNITCTPFIHLEDEEEAVNLSRRGTSLDVSKRMSSDNHISSGIFKGRPKSEMVSPYNLLFDNKLDVLRPDLAPVLHIEDELSYTGTIGYYNLSSLHNAYAMSPLLQIISLRSRPDAFASPVPNIVAAMEDEKPGTVNVKVLKVGILARRDPKKKGSRAWRDYGVILTSSQLLMFRNIQWIKTLIVQRDLHRERNKTDVLIFTPPLSEYNPDIYQSTVDAVAFTESVNATKDFQFRFVARGGTNECFQASSEEDMNDWIAKINFTTAFRSSGIRMKGAADDNDYITISQQRARRPNASSSTISSVPAISRSVQQPSIRVVENTLVRRHVLKQKLIEIEARIAKNFDKYNNDLRFAKNIALLTPILPSTRQRVINSAAMVEARLYWNRIELAKDRSQRDVLLRELEMEKELNRDINTPPSSPQLSKALKSPSSPMFGRQKSNKWELPKLSFDHEDRDSKEWESGSWNVMTDNFKNLNVLSGGTSAISSPVEVSKFSFPVVDGSTNGAELKPRIPSQQRKQDDESFELHGRKVSVVKVPSNLPSPARLRPTSLSSIKMMSIPDKDKEPSTPTSSIFSANKVSFMETPKDIKRPDSAPDNILNNDADKSKVNGRNSIEDIRNQDQTNGQTSDDPFLNDTPKQKASEFDSHAEKYIKEPSGHNRAASTLTEYSTNEIFETPRGSFEN